MANDDLVQHLTKMQKDALKEIARCSGSQFDPDLADIFINMMKKNCFNYS